MTARSALPPRPQTPPEGIYPAGLDSFEFARTVSRLREMQSAGYWAAEARRDLRRHR